MFLPSVVAPTLLVSAGDARRCSSQPAVFVGVPSGSLDTRHGFVDRVDEQSLPGGVVSACSDSEFNSLSHTPRTPNLTVDTPYYTRTKLGAYDYAPPRAGRKWGIGIAGSHSRK